MGVFNVRQKQYHANRFQGAYEIVSLTGTVTTKDGEFYAHLHMCAGNEQGQAFGGHLNRAVISATCEMVIQIIDGTVERRFSEDVGLNLFRFCWPAGEDFSGILLTFCPQNDMVKWLSKRMRYLI